jgi:hypothetical protein
MDVTLKVTSLGDKVDLGCSFRDFSESGALQLLGNLHDEVYGFNVLYVIRTSACWNFVEIAVMFEILMASMPPFLFKINLSDSGESLVLISPSVGRVACLALIKIHSIRFNLLVIRGTCSPDLVIR